MKINDLTVSQSSVRNPEQIHGLVKLAKAGGKFLPSALTGNDKNPILISELPDGLLLIHNGHHRCIAAQLARGPEGFLYPEEYTIEKRTYEEYENFNPPLYVTPFNPREEVRLPDFRSYKHFVIAAFNNEGFEKAEQWSVALAVNYKTKRKGLHSVNDLIIVYMDELRKKALENNELA